MGVATVPVTVSTPVATAELSYDALMAMALMVVTVASGAVIAPLYSVELAVGVLPLVV